MHYLLFILDYDKGAYSFSPVMTMVVTVSVISITAVIATFFCCLRRIQRYNSVYQGKISNNW